MSDTKTRTIGEMLGLKEVDVLQGVIASLHAEIRGLEARIEAEEADHRRWEERGRSKRIDRSIKVLCESCGHDITER